MKKFFFFLAVCLSVLFLNACSKEPDANIETNKMVGSWVWNYYDETDPNYVLFVIYTFNADGTGTCFEYDDGSIDSDDDPFLYLYDEDTSMLKIMWVENGNVRYTSDGVINWISSTSFYCDHLADKGSVFVKQ